MSDATPNANALWQTFRDRTASLASRPAVSTPAGALTFEELFHHGDALAAALAGAGVREADPVALALPNSLAFVPAFLASTKLSVPVALVSPKYRESELQSIHEAVRPQCFVTTPKLAKVLAERLTIVRSATVSAEGLGGDLVLLFPVPVSSPPPAGLGANMALLKFTSGSTGVPKGIALTVDNVLAEARNVTATLGLTPEDRILAPVPLYHSYGFDVGVLSMLHSGAHLAMRNGFVPRRALGALSGKDVTVFLGVPSMYRIFVDTLLTDTPDLTHVRYLLSCTAPLRPKLITAFHETFHVPICQHYGSSETGAVTNHVPGAVLDRPGSVGRPLDGVQVWIQDDAGNPLAAGVEGEVVVKSGAVAPGYVMGKPPGESKFKGDTYRTGDLGVLDEAGFLHLRGRKDDVINVGGFKVSPSEVAQVLEQFPAVREAAVIGVKDAQNEEVVCAAVTLDAPATEKKILAFCRTRLSDYKVPRALEILEEMPRGPSGKIRLTPKDIGR